MPDTSAAPRAHAVLEENLWSMWSQLGRAPGCALHESDEALWFETPIPVPPYNMVVRFQGNARADQAMDEIFARFAARKIPFIWLVHPSARPADLAARLRTRGFEEVEALTGMAADLNALPAVPALPPGVEIHEVTFDADGGVALQRRGLS